MKTAIIYSGQARSFARCIENHRFMLLSRFPGAWVFASVADDEDAGDMELLRKLVPGDKLVIERCDQPEIDEPDNLAELIAAAPNPIAAHSSVQGVLKQFWQLERAGRFLKSQKFDCVVRVRPDLMFHSMPAIMHGIYPGDVNTPWWSRSGGVNDRFAIMGQFAAERYFGTLSWAQQTGWAQGCPVHPETMLATSLKAQGCNIKATLGTTFSFLRKSGEFILPDPTLADLADLQIALKNG